MTGKILVTLLLTCAAVAGVSIYYLQIYGFYYDVEPVPGQDVMLLPLAGDVPQPIAYGAFQAIDADSSPIRYRACFDTDLGLDDLSASYRGAGGAEPLSTPGWFGCFDESALGEALREGSARAYVGIKNIHYGVDRIVAVTQDGKGYVWHVLNDCGQKAYDGTVIGEACPPRPQE